MRNKFPGFRSPNYTQVPDELFDELLPDLSGSELKVLLYIIRRTFGFKRNSDRISTSQIMHGIKTTNGKQLDRGTGLSNRAIINAVKSLEKKNIIIAHRQVNKEKGYLPITYSLNILLPYEKSSQGDRNPYEKSSQGASDKSSQALMKKVHKQETVLQETDNNVNVWGTEDEKNKKFIEILAQDLAKQLNDYKSLNFYKKVIGRLPRQIIHQALGETRELAQLGKIKKSMGACFTDIIKRLAKGKGINIKEEKKPVSPEEARRIISQIKKRISKDG